MKYKDKIVLLVWDFDCLHLAQYILIVMMILTGNKTWLKDD